jgi:hypothetical protein
VQLAVCTAMHGPLHAIWGLLLTLLMCARPAFAHRQGHIGLLESTPENQQALLLGLDYLVNISYVDVSAR